MEEITQNNFIKLLESKRLADYEFVGDLAKECFELAKQYHIQENKKVWDELPESNELDMNNTSPFLRNKNLFVMGADAMKEKCIPVISILKQENEELKSDINEIIVWIEDLNKPSYMIMVRSIAEIMDKYKYAKK